MAGCWEGFLAHRTGTVCRWGSRGERCPPFDRLQARQLGAGIPQAAPAYGQSSAMRLVWVGLGRGRNAPPKRDETANVSMVRRGSMPKSATAWGMQRGRASGPLAKIAVLHRTSCTSHYSDRHRKLSRLCTPPSALKAVVPFHPRRSGLYRAKTATEPQRRQEILEHPERQIVASRIHLRLGHDALCRRHPMQTRILRRGVALDKFVHRPFSSASASPSS